jgi:putative iron-regulated protein
MNPRLLLLLTAAFLPTACGDDDDDGGLGDARAVLDRYADVARAGYGESLAGAQSLDDAIDAFVADPTAGTLEAARDAWLDAREPYGQTEVFRFYDGPIDDAATGPEGRINAWPLDENRIDYTRDEPSAGMINDAAGFPELTGDIIAAENETPGEKDITLGYHAIEFLLWGQDDDEPGTGAGTRPHTDYVDGGTAANQARRRDFLVAVSQLLVEDLQSVVDAWDASAAYGTEWAGVDAVEGLRRMLTGMGSLSGAELSGERMTVALENRDQEDEHSCFSDNTHRDVYLNALGIQNVYLGRFGDDDGPGLDELVRARDPDLDARMQSELEASLAAIQAIPEPFDVAIDDDDEGRALVQAAIDALRTQTQTTAEIATLLGVTLNLE